MTGKTVGGPKILLVDDDKIVIEALTDLFKRILPAVGIGDSATSGVEALELFASNADQYALVLLDMSLEGMQGPEVCRRMRLMDCSTPILGMTSFSLNRYRVPLAAAGAQGLVGKGDETHAPCRRLMAEHGAGFTVSEMVSSRALVYGDHKTVRSPLQSPKAAP